MAFVREARNAVKIEGWRLSRVPIDPTESIFQGDMLCWNSGTKQVTKAVTGNEANFVGIADHTNPVLSAGILTANLTDTRMNVIQAGLVELIVEASATYFPFDGVKIGADAQSVKLGSAPQIGICDPAVGAAGKAYQAGDYVLIWLRVPDAFRAFF
jgi:hypothetical protein